MDTEFFFDNFILFQLKNNDRDNRHFATTFVA